VNGGDIKSELELVPSPTMTQCFNKSIVFEVVLVRASVGSKRCHSEIVTVGASTPETGGRKNSAGEIRSEIHSRRGEKMLVHCDAQVTLRSSKYCLRS